MDVIRNGECSMGYAAKQPGNPTFGRNQDAFSWHEALCLQHAANASFGALTSWLVISLLVAAFAAGLVAFGSATMTSAVPVALAGLASLYFGYLECLKLIECSCEGRVRPQA
jgi:hypothetical protein